MVAWAVKVHGRFRLSVMVSLEPEESQCTKRKGRFLSFSLSSLMPPQKNAEEMVIERIIPLSAKKRLPHLSHHMTRTGKEFGKAAGKLGRPHMCVARLGIHHIPYTERGGTRNSQTWAICCTLARGKAAFSFPFYSRNECA